MSLSKKEIIELSFGVCLVIIGVIMVIMHFSK
jgi:hypothetical protein